MDEEARKQLVLTRIAQQRLQLAQDVADMRVAAEPRRIASSALRSMLPQGVDRALFRAPDGRSRSLAAGIGSQALRAVLIARRYPILLSIAGGLLARRAIRRLLVVGFVGAAVVVGVSMLKSRRLNADRAGPAVR